MRRGPIAGVIAVAAVGMLGVAPAAADHDGADHSNNVRLIARYDQGDEYRQGSDLAFWGDIAIAGNYDNPGGFWVMDIAEPQRPRQIGQFVCPGSQADVSIWEDLVFMSVDSPRVSSECGAGAAAAQVYAQGQAWEGIRVVSIANPARPVQIAAVDTDCGSHTHTLVPDLANDRLLIYALSYPLGGQGVECNAVSHRKISVVEVPLDEPEKARVLKTPSVAPAVGCHDVTVFMEQQIAAAACITETQMWDISDPTEPRILSHIVNPAVNIHHSTTFSWNADTIVIGDELGGALATPGCFTEGHAPLGALWFYDVSNPSSPVMRGWYQTQNQAASLFCTAHNFNVVPQTDRDILVTGWYNGGTIVLDFTNPATPTRLGYYVPQDDGQTAAWSSYWYNGYIFSNNFDEDVNSLTAESRGFDVFRFTGAATNGAIELPFMNPQTQMALPRAKAQGSGSGGTGTKVLGGTHTDPLPATGLPAASAVAIGVLTGSAALAAALRRSRLFVR